MLNRVYRLCSPLDGQTRYVGITKLTLKARLRTHIHESRRGTRAPVYDWLRKLQSLETSPSIVLIEDEVERDREIFWIAHYRSIGCRLLNCTAGGDGLRDPTPETRAKISASLKGRKPRPLSAEARAAIARSKVGIARPPETRAKIRAALLGKPSPHPPPTAETRAKIAATLTGRKLAPFSEEHRRRISEAQRGKVLTAEQRQKIRAARARQVITDEHRAAISIALKGKPKSAKHAAAVGAAQRGKPKIHRNGHFAAVLKPEQVREARRLRSEAGWSGPRVAAHLGVNESVIYCLLSGKTYRHVI